MDILVPKDDLTDREIGMVMESIAPRRASSHHLAARRSNFRLGTPTAEDIHSEVPTRPQYVIAPSRAERGRLEAAHGS
jgi:hypothetical protein